jgi:hypothetical protein
MLRIIICNLIGTFCALSGGLSAAIGMQKQFTYVFNTGFEGCCRYMTLRLFFDMNERKGRKTVLGMHNVTKGDII